MGECKRQKEKPRQNSVVIDWNSLAQCFLKSNLYKQLKKELGELDSFHMEDSFHGEISGDLRITFKSKNLIVSRED